MLTRNFYEVVMDLRLRGTPSNLINELLSAHVDSLKQAYDDGVRDALEAGGDEDE
jgi:hypothetical protein